MLWSDPAITVLYNYGNSPANFERYHKTKKAKLPPRKRQKRNKKGFISLCNGVNRKTGVIYGIR